MSDDQQARDKSPDEADGQTILGLMNQLREHVVTRTSADWESLGRVVRAFATNYSELSILITAPDENPGLLLSIFDQSNEAERESYFDELYRCLHNFLAILATLIDNARVLAKKYEGTEFESEYQKLVLDLALLPEAAFLKDFRNYLVHRSVPPLAMNVSMGREGTESGLQSVSFSITLNSKRLLEWDRWKKESRQFLQAREKVVLIDCVTDYNEQIMALYSWMFPHYEVLHAREIDEYRALQDRLRELLDIKDA